MNSKTFLNIDSIFFRFYFHESSSTCQVLVRDTHVTQGTLQYIQNTIAEKQKDLEWEYELSLINCTTDVLTFIVPSNIHGITLRLNNTSIPQFTIQSPKLEGVTLRYYSTYSDCNLVLVNMLCDTQLRFNKLDSSSQTSRLSSHLDLVNSKLHVQLINSTWGMYTFSAAAELAQIYFPTIYNTIDTWRLGEMDSKYIKNTLIKDSYILKQKMAVIWKKYTEDYTDLYDNYTLYREQRKDEEAALRSMFSEILQTYETDVYLCDETKKREIESMLAKMYYNKPNSKFTLITAHPTDLDNMFSKIKAYSESYYSYLNYDKIQYEFYNSDFSIASSYGYFSSEPVRSDTSVKYNRSDTVNLNMCSKKPTEDIFSQIEQSEYASYVLPMFQKVVKFSDSPSAATEEIGHMLTSLYFLAQSQAVFTYNPLYTYLPSSTQLLASTQPTQILPSQVHTQQTVQAFHTN